MKKREDEQKIKKNLYKTLKKGRVALVCQSLKNSNTSFIYDFMDYYVSKNKKSSIYYILLSTSKDDHFGISINTYVKVIKFQELRNIIMRGNLSLAVIDFNLLKRIKEEENKSIESMLEDIKKLAIHRNIPILVFSSVPVQIEIGDSQCFLY